MQTVTAYIRLWQVVLYVGFSCNYNVLRNIKLQKSHCAFVKGKKIELAFTH